MLRRARRARCAVTCASNAPEIDPNPPIHVFNKLDWDHQKSERNHLRSPSSVTRPFRAAACARGALFRRLILGRSIFTVAMSLRRSSRCTTTTTTASAITSSAITTSATTAAAVPEAKCRLVTSASDEVFSDAALKGLRARRVSITNTSGFKRSLANGAAKKSAGAVDFAQTAWGAPGIVQDFGSAHVIVIKGLLPDAAQLLRDEVAKDWRERTDTHIRDVPLGMEATAVGGVGARVGMDINADSPLSQMLNKRTEPLMARLGVKRAERIGIKSRKPAAGESRRRQATHYDYSQRRINQWVSASTCLSPAAAAPTATPLLMLPILLLCAQVASEAARAEAGQAEAAQEVLPLDASALVADAWATHH